MTIEKIKKTVLDSLDGLGLSISGEEDFCLSEFISDSLQFISFVFEIETQLGMEMPTEFLNLEKMSSFESYCSMLYDYLDNENALITQSKEVINDERT